MQSLGGSPAVHGDLRLVVCSSKANSLASPDGHAELCGLSIDKVWAAKKQAEWAEVVRLAEQVFPRDWTVRVEQFEKESFVRIMFIPTYGTDPIDALKKAIAWYREQVSHSRIVLPK